MSKGCLAALFGWRNPTPSLADVLDSHGVVGTTEELAGDHPRLGGQADPVVCSLRGELAAGQWQHTAQQVATTRDWDRRAWLLDRLSDWTSTPPWMDRWVSEAPDHTAAWLIRGLHQLRLAWAHGAPPDSKRLQAALADLQHAATLDEHDPCPWAWQITCLRGLGAPSAAIEATFAEATARAPLHAIAHDQMLRGLTVEAGGSDAELFAFARSACDLAPVGHGLHTLVASAHILRWLRFLRATDPSGSTGWWQRDDVRSELLASAERSVLHPRYRRSVNTPQERNTWAFTLWLLGAWPEAWELFEALDGHVTERPWCNLDDPVSVYIAARNTTHTQLTPPTS